MLFGCYTLQKTSAFSSNKPVIFIGNQNFQRGKFSKISFFFPPSLLHLCSLSEVGLLVLVHISSLPCWCSCSLVLVDGWGHGWGCFEERCGYETRRILVALPWSLPSVSMALPYLEGIWAGPIFPGAASPMLSGGEIKQVRLKQYEKAQACIFSTRQVGKQSLMSAAFSKCSSNTFEKGQWHYSGTLVWNLSKAVASTRKCVFYFWTSMPHFADSIRKKRNVWVLQDSADSKFHCLINNWKWLYQGSMTS